MSHSQMNVPSKPPWIGDFSVTHLITRGQNQHNQGINQQSWGYAYQPAVTCSNDMQASQRIERGDWTLLTQDLERLFCISFHWPKTKRKFGGVQVSNTCIYIYIYINNFVKMLNIYNIFKTILFCCDFSCIHMCSYLIIF